MFSTTRPYEWVLVGLLPAHPRLKREDFPLISARVHYDLSDVQMLANLTQTYTSNASIETEIRYVFALPPDASICGFKAVIDGDRTITGVVKEKKKAKAEYEQAIAQGKTAAVLEQQNVEIFKVSLGNIRPKQTIEVHISFVAVVTHDGTLDSLRLTFPSTIAPRYGTPPASLSSSYGYRANHSALDFSVAVDMASHIKSITSPSHPIAMKFGESTIEPSADFDPTKARISLTSPTLLEKDIVVVLSCQGLDKPRCMVESFSPEEGSQEYTDAYALTLVPRFELPALPSQEYIFLVDRSGSMGGGKMDAVRSALQILLMSLPSRGTYFNIISFGSHHTSLWPSSVTYSAESVKTASAHVDSMTANYGGTEIRAAIVAAVNSRIARPGGQTTATSMFVLTDGEAYDLDGVQSSIGASVKEAKAAGLLLRIFCMGIGNSVSKAMCDRIARAGQGTTAFVGETEKPDQKLMGLLRAARGAAIENVSIDWGIGADDDDDQDFEMVSSKDETLQTAAPIPLSLFDESHTVNSEKIDVGPQPIAITLPPPPRVQQAPATASLPSLYPDFRTSLFAIVKRGASGNTAPSQSVQIKGSVFGRPVTLAVPVSQTSRAPAAEFSSTKMLHALAARALIQSIEESGDKFMSETQKAEVLRLAERYGLASSQTSFVAIDELGAPVDFQVRPEFVEFSRPLGGGLFGSMPPPPAPRSIDVFGGPAPMQLSFGASLRGGGGSFGSAAPPTQFLQQYTPTSARRSSGQPGSAAPPTQSFQQSQQSSGLFGSAAATRSFGSSPPGAPQVGGLFGSAATTQTLGSSPPGATQIGGLFGSMAATESFDSSPQSTTDDLLALSPGSGSQASSLFGGTVPASSQVFGAPSRFGAPSQVPGFGGGVFQSARTSSATPQQQLPASSSAALGPSIETFARLQAFDGSFAGSAPLFQLLVQQVQAPVMPTALEGAGVNKETVWCTLLCVAYLETKFATDKDVWAILVEKAMDFVQDSLQGLGVSDEQVNELRRAARGCIV